MSDSSPETVEDTKQQDKQLKLIPRQQQKPSSGLFEPTSDHAEPIFYEEPDRGVLIANKSEACSAIASNTAFPAPPVPKPRTFHSKNPEVQIESIQSEFWIISLHNTSVLSSNINVSNYCKLQSRGVVHPPNLQAMQLALTSIHPS